MFRSDFWYDNRINEVTSIDVIFYPNAGEYRGNMYILEKAIGDYSATDSIELENSFPQLAFNWD